MAKKKKAVQKAKTSRHTRNKPKHTHKTGAKQKQSASKLELSTPNFPAPADFSKEQPSIHPHILEQHHAAKAAAAKKGLTHTATSIIGSAILTAIISFVFLFIFKIGSIYTFGLSAAVFVGFAIGIYSVLEKSG